MTAEPKSGEKLLTPEEAVEVNLILSGERERLRKLAREKLEHSGWTDELRQLCRAYAAKCGADALTHQGIVSEVQAQGRGQVPDYLKAELLGRIKTALSE